MRDSIANPVALVTGGARRVGADVVRTLSGTGYRVVVHANTSTQEAAALVAELAAQGNEALAVTADVSQSDQVRRMFAEVNERFGRLDALVNCAAIWQPQPLETSNADDVRRHFEANTLGTYLCCQQAGLTMAGQTTGGAIVNVGDWAIARPYPDYSAYFASKGSIPALTRSFAVELARRNPRVRVNAVLPGPVLLPADMPADERAAAIAATLVQREGSPHHVSHAIVFLLENDFVTGVCVPVDGGRTIYSAD